MKNLLLSSFIFLFSCASFSDSFQKIEKSQEHFTPSYLIDFKENSFKISIEAFGNQFGGILVSKKLETNHFRFAFINEFGGKMLDFELENHQLKLNYAVDELNRKMLLNLLEKDFNLIFSKNNKIENQFEFEEFEIFECSVPNLKKPVYYFINSETGNLEKISLSKYKEEISLHLISNEKNWPEIEISHQKMPIKIYLHLLD